MSFPFLDLGPAKIELDGVDLGETDSVVATYAERTAEHKTAQYGDSPKDEIYVGAGGQIEVNLKESTLAQLALVAGNAVVTGHQIAFKSPVGTSLRSIAGKFVIKPYEAGVASTDAKKFITFPLASPKIDASLTFDATSDRMLKTVFVFFKVASASEIPTGETWEVGDQWFIGYGETA